MTNLDYPVMEELESFLEKRNMSFEDLYKRIPVDLRNQKNFYDKPIENLNHFLVRDLEYLSEDEFIELFRTEKYCFIPLSNDEKAVLKIFLRTQKDNIKVQKELERKK